MYLHRLHRQIYLVQTDSFLDPFNNKISYFEPKLPLLINKFKRFSQQMVLEKTPMQILDISCFRSLNV